MEDKIKYEHQVYSNADTALLVESAVLELDSLSTHLNKTIGDIFNQLPDAPQEELTEFQDIINDAASDLSGTLSNQYGGVGL